jgi:hypothetical protein
VKLERLERQFLKMIEKDTLIVSRDHVVLVGEARRRRPLGDEQIRLIV